MIKSGEIPLVAVTGASFVHRDDHDSPLRVVRDAYFRVIEEAGGIAVLVSNTKDKRTLDEYVRLFNFLLLTGGGDIDPKRYGEVTNSQTGQKGMTLDPTRDESELYLIKEFIKAGKPVLGICRGSQLINVALGGSLIQNLQNTGVNHLILDADGSWYKRVHPVEFMKNTLLESLTAIAPMKEYMVNSVHHQAIGEVGNGLIVAAKAPDGVIEAIESIDMSKQFILGVQWHPEQLKNDYMSELIIKAFLQFKHS